MKNSSSVKLCLVVVTALVCSFVSVDADAKEYYYAIEMGGTLCGYSKIVSTPKEIDGREQLVIDHEVLTHLSVGKQSFRSKIDLIYHLDPKTGAIFFHGSEIEQGQVKLDRDIRIDGAVATISSSSMTENQEVEIPEGTTFENTLVFPHLVADFAATELSEKTYDVFEVREIEVQKVIYTRLEVEQLDLDVGSFECVKFERTNQVNGLRTQLWIDMATGVQLKSVYPGNRVSYLADRSVSKRIKVADVVDALLSRVDVNIVDPQAISYMQVRGAFEPTGLRVSVESLNVPGQAFSGKVEENRIDGVFELELARYDGANAPPFPAEPSHYVELERYLVAEGWIESDDQVLIDKARDLTRGAVDSWDATKRISRWVAKNIDYAIPGGATARKTFDLRAGECGAHSFLTAALCRAVGIPARVVWGSMYVPSFGGAFGQHAWNEIFMGEAGWVPIDTTAYEIDYIDSGHIRIGEYESPMTALNPKEVEVLDYRIGDGDIQNTHKENRFMALTGAYRNLDNQRTVNVVAQDGSLAIDIPGKMVLSFHEPDEHGVWTCKLTDRVYVIFDEDNAGGVSGMKLHEVVRMRRTPDEGAIPEGASENVAGLLGFYHFAQVNADFEVSFEGGGLVLKDPLAKKTISLQPTDGSGAWEDSDGRMVLEFERDNDGRVERLILDSVNRFKRVAADEE
jgi:transglutaminase-like putative cysteine protease